MEYIAFFIAIILVILLAIFSIILLPQNQSNNRLLKKQNNKNKVQINNFSKSSNNSVNKIKLEKQLLKLLNNDRQAMQRLINYLKQKHPAQKEEWYWEKAIFDLERDRR